MVEPPEAGFTGVVWEARPTDQLARELTTGPGSVPLADAATAWTRLAASFGAAVVDYDRIMTAIREHWRSGTSDEVLDRITTMRHWLLDVANAAARNAAHAGEQATAYEVARLAMPHVAEIAALEQAMRTVQAIGASLGAPMVGAAADISADQDVAKAGAARVMRTYEAATVPLAESWQQALPPTLATGTALESEQATTATTSAVKAATVPTADYTAAAMAMEASVLRDLSALAVSPPPLTDSRVETVVEKAPVSEFSTAQVSPVSTGATAGQAVPGAAGPMAGAASADEEHTARAGSANSEYGGELEIDAGLAAAPPVLGGVETPSVTYTGTA